MSSAPPRYNPWPFALTLPLLSAFPNATSLGIATVYFKSLGYSNAFIGYTGALFIPFAASFLWAPWLDRIGTKRGWQLGLTLGLAVIYATLAGAVALRMVTPWPALAIIGIVAVVGGTAEVSMNGFFLHALDASQQAGLSGVRVAAIRCGHVLASGLLVKVCADYGTRVGDPVAGWTRVFGVLAAAFFAAFVYHSWVLPRPPSDRPAASARESGFYFRVWQEFRSLPRIGSIAAFYLTYRFGEGLMARMISPFLLDPPSQGGVGLSVADVAVAQGTIGAVAAIAGGIFGGWLVKTLGLRRTALPLAICMTLPHAGYLWLASVRTAPYLAIQSCVAVETFGYGMGFASMFTLTMVMSRGEFRSTFAAIFVALWSIGWLVPTFFSGLIQTQIGYFWLFALSMVAAIPGILLVLRLPLAQLDLDLLGRPAATVD